MENKKKEKTKIDIILPNYNNSQLITETIKSVLKQTYKNWKLIIVDDYSDEKTRSVLKKISKNKNIKVVTLTDSSHLFPLEKYKETTEIISNFLF